jgi:hypothetical protein
VSINFPITLPFYSSAFTKALRRDDYCCIFTGQYDWKSSDNVPQEVAAFTSLKCAHIFPQSTNTISGADKDAKVWFAVLSLFLWLLTTMCSASMPHQYGQS